MDGLWTDTLNSSSDKHHRVGMKGGPLIVHRGASYEGKNNIINMQLATKQGYLISKCGFNRVNSMRLKAVMYTQL